MKNVGILKFAFIVALATPVFSFGMHEYAPSQSGQVLQDCPICVMEPENPVRLHGNHVLCTACFDNQIVRAHANRNAAKSDQMLQCPFAGCQYQITEADVRRIAPHRLAQFQEIQQAQKEKLESRGNTGFGDIANLFWKFQHTKPCPNCKTAIEKNSGCKWVNCTRCNREFCYTCLTPSRPGHLHDIHNPCVENKHGWDAEKQRLGLDKMQPYIIAAVAVCVVIWGIAELYNYIKAKKAKKAGVKKQPFVRSRPQVRRVVRAGAR